MDGFDLTPEEEELLNQIAPGTTLDQLGGAGGGLDTRAAVSGGGTLVEDDEIFSDGEGDANREDDDELAKKGYVKRSDFDRMSGELEGLRKTIGTRDAAAPPAAAPPVQTYIPPAAATPPVMTQEQRAELVAKFFEDPIGFTNMIAQNAVQAERAANAGQHLDTQVTIARGEAQRIREEVARDFPQYKAALPLMDKLMAETSPETMAALIKSGKLRDVYMDNFKAKAFDVAHKVTSTVISRRRSSEQREAPPELGGRGIASVTAIDRVRNGSKEIKMSDLNEIDREAVAQWKKMGWTNAEIFQELKKAN